MALSRVYDLRTMGVTYLRTMGVTYLRTMVGMPVVPWWVCPWYHGGYAPYLPWWVCTLPPGYTPPYHPGYTTSRTWHVGVLRCTVCGGVREALGSEGEKALGESPPFSLS